MNSTPHFTLYSHFLHSLFPSFLVSRSLLLSEFSGQNHPLISMSNKGMKKEDKEMCFPEAVAEYSNGGSKGLIPMARKQLSAAGWRLYYQKKGASRVMQCRSPEGKVFYSLLSACRWYTREQQLSVKAGDFVPDYICSVCHDDGDLIHCEKCPSAFHARCLGLRKGPEGSWICPSCCCILCKLVAMDDSMHKCAQCAHRYHAACLRRKGQFQKPQENGNWFCSLKCEKIYLGLQNLLGKSVAVVGQDDLEWRLYSPLEGECVISKLSEAVGIIHECFEPVTEAYNGRDTGEDAVFNKGSDLQRLNVQGFYTLALERNDEMIIVALIRIHGEKVAEMPLVATRFQYQRRGMCRILMNILENTLMELGIEKLVLPAAKSVLDTWVNKFGFSRVKKPERLNFVDCTFLDFYGTIFCQKRLNGILSQEEHSGGNSISEATRQQIQKKLTETSNSKRKATDVFRHSKRRKLASNGSHSLCVC